MGARVVRNWHLMSRKPGTGKVKKSFGHLISTKGSK